MKIKAVTIKNKKTGKSATIAKVPKPNYRKIRRIA